MRCDIIAEGIIAAARELDLSIPVVVRLQGKHSMLCYAVCISPAMGSVVNLNDGYLELAFTQESTRERRKNHGIYILRRP